MIKNILIISLITVFFVACKQSNSYINKNYKNRSSIFTTNSPFTNINEASQEIATQLLHNIPRSYPKNNKYVLTTFVKLDKFDNTSKFGRVLGENLIDELHKRKFKIIDFRAKESILVNKNGEFSLTRDILKLKDEIPEALVVVGTYSTIENNLIIINARIINNFTSDVISTAKVIYKYEDCKFFDICKKEIIKPKVIINMIPRIKDFK